MLNSNKDNLSLFDQWGGKLALFFTYTHMSHDLTTGLLVALLPFIRHDLNLNYLQAGFLVSAFSLAAGFSQFLGGWLSDRMSRRTGIALGLGGVGLSSILTGLMPSYYTMLAALVVMGVLAGFYHPSAVSALTDRFEPKRLGRAISLHMLGGSLGFGVGPLFGALIASKLNWQAAFIILGIPAIAASLLVLTRLKLPTITCSSVKTVSVEERPVTVWKVFRDSAGIVAVSVGMALITGPIMSFIPLFLVDVHHLTVAAGSMWVTIIRIGGLVGSLFGGWLTDRWGRRRTIFLALALFGPVVLLLVYLPFGIPLGIVFVLFGWLLSMRETTMQTYLMDKAPPQLRATVFGIYFGFGQQGSSIIQPAAGDLMDAIGISGVFNIIAYISAGLSALAIYFAYRMIKRRRAP